jgi:D-3-phosphoglycerate dehydrogenase
MSHFKIILTDGLEERGQEILRVAGQVDNRPNIQPEELLQVIGEYEAMIVRGRTKVTQALFDAAVRLRVVGRAGVGIDNIDLQAARDHGVCVVNAPASTTLAVAELTLGLLLALARSIPRADAAMKAGQWLKKELIGIEISGKTLGVVGMGHIGAAVAQRATALGMSVVGYDAWLPAEEIAKRGARAASLAEVYAQADFITYHIPLTAETRQMVDAQALASMKPGVRLICTARGGIIDEAALLSALESGQVAGAALDVFAQEPPGATALIAHPNVIATPHIGAQTEEAQARAAEDIAHEVLAALEDRPLRWRVV